MHRPQDMVWITQEYPVFVTRGGFLLMLFEEA